MKKLIAGNWKMNGTLDGAAALARAVCDGGADMAADVDILLCPPFVHLPAVVDAVRGCGAVMVGAQDCSAHGSGAYTGEVSAAMLAETGCGAVILGHSERRQYHAETSALVAAKAAQAHACGLLAVICVGETETERERGEHESIVAAQLAGSLPPSATAGNTVIAYEPVWAIGTGKTATPDDVAAMHCFIRGQVGAGMRILYGGSVKADNAAALLHTPDVNGALVGGASLKAEDFLSIIASAR